MNRLACAVGALFLLVACGSPDAAWPAEDADEAGGRGSGGGGGSMAGAHASGGSTSSGRATGGATASGGAYGTGGAYPTSGSSAGPSTPPTNEGDNYEAPGTNPFIVTRHDPLSTFAADADTASYDIFRRDVEDGALPQRDSVRLEEYVNRFDYDYEPPASDASDPFEIHLSASPGFFAGDTSLLRVGIQGRLPSEQKKPANLVFLVDTSGSMASADKLPLVKVVLSETVHVLAPTDTISIVTYAGSTAVRLPPTPVSNVDKIQAVIDGFESGGSTAGAAGIDLAYAQAQAGFIEDGTNHVLLCTDGDFNVGPATTDELISLIEEKRRTGITLTVLGFGVGNLNDALMEGVADAGNGIYSVISSEDQAIEYANEEMLRNLEHIARDMKVQVEFNPEHVYAYRQLGYENRAIADSDFRDDLVDAGEVPAGHAVTALYELVPTGAAIPTPSGAPDVEDGADSTDELGVSGDDWVLVRVRYKQPGAAESDPAIEVVKALRATDIAESYDALDSDFQWALAVSAFAEILKKSPYAEPERIDDIALVIGAPAQANHADRAEFQTLFDLARSRLPAP